MIAQEFQAFEIRPKIDQSSFTYEVIETTFEDDEQVCIIGSCPRLLQQRIDEDRAGATEKENSPLILKRNRPTRCLQALIDDNANPSVGGMVQQGWATRVGFELVAKLRPIPVLPPSTRNAGMFVLGFDMLDMQQVGDNHFGLMGSI